MAAARQPNPLDVLFGKGIEMDTHPGNLRYRLICGHFQPIYTRARLRQTKRETVETALLAVMDDQEDGRSRHRWLPNGEYQRRFATYEQALAQSSIRFLVKQESATGGTPTWTEADYSAILDKVQHRLRGKPKRRQRPRHAASTAAVGGGAPPAAVARRQEPSSPTAAHESSILEADLLATPTSVTARAPQHDVVYDPFLSLPTAAAQPLETSDRRSLMAEPEDQDEPLSSAFFLAHPKDDDVHSV